MILNSIYESCSILFWFPPAKKERVDFFWFEFQFFPTLISPFYCVLLLREYRVRRTHRLITTRFFINFSKRRWQTPPPPLLLLRKRRHPKPWPRCFLFSSSPFFPVSSFQSRCTESAVDLDFSASSPERRKTQKRKEEEEEEQGRRR